MKYVPDLGRIIEDGWRLLRDTEKEKCSTMMGIGKKHGGSKRGLTFAAAMQVIPRKKVH